MIEGWDRWNKEVKEVTDDLNLEVILTELLAQRRLKENDVLLSPNGGKQRAVDRDIAKILGPYSTKLDTPRGTFSVNRRGIYDGLPEGMFHQNRENIPFRDLSQILDEMAYQRSVEEEARRFFLPIDHELLYASSLIAENESVLTANLLGEKSKGIMDFWQIPEVFSQEEKGRLVFLLPYTHQIVSSTASIAEVISLVLQVAVEIEEVAIPEDFSKAEPASSALGSGQLGVDMMTKGEGLQVDSMWKMQVGPLPSEELHHYCPGGIAASKLSYLAQCFFPADRLYEVNHILHPEAMKFQMSEELSTSRLGMSTMLNV